MFTALIPARWASTRLPGKPLADICGKPMVVRVAERAIASGAARVVVATDDRRIVDAVAAHGVAAVLTRADHPTGTDRLAEAAAQLNLAPHDIVVNVQGDEPLLASALIRRIADLLAASPDASIATACHPIHDAREAFGRAVRTLPSELPLYRHYGLYAYRVDFLMRYPTLPAAPIERFESLEQLRALWHGYKIVVEITTGTPAPGVDTPADLEQARAVYARQKNASD